MKTEDEKKKERARLISKCQDVRGMVEHRGWLHLKEDIENELERMRSACFDPGYKDLAAYQKYQGKYQGMIWILGRIRFYLSKEERLVKMMDKKVVH